jgi:hypothetical protein
MIIEYRLYYLNAKRTVRLRDTFARMQRDIVTHLPRRFWVSEVGRP